MTPITVTPVVTGMMGENCYLVRPNGGRDMFLIDPGDGIGHIESAIGEFSPCRILLTHGHFDHILAAPGLRKKYRCPITVGAPDDALLSSADKNVYQPAYCEMPFAAFQADDTLEMRIQTITVCGVSVECIPTPGHTPGGMTYYLPQAGIAFTGDTVFDGSVGRTDFPGGSMMQLVQSVKLLASHLPGDTLLYPGHGGATTVNRMREDLMI